MTAHRPALKSIPKAERTVHEGVELALVVLVGVALAAGAVTRALTRGTPVPYTVAMSVVGLVVGLGAQRLGGDGLLAHGLALGTGITPAVILLVLLPALIFESAFGLDVHAFRKDAGAVGVLAVPALLVTAGLLAGAALALARWQGWGWGWSEALVLGALLSATDPVAVVAVLREAGAPPRLSTLIEGESLLNDGTAIVLGGVLLTALAGGGLAGVSLGAAFGSLLRVVIGGVLLGLALAGVVSHFVGRTFNDPPVEITSTLVLAYGAMILGEAVLHVSGVLAVVAAGLFMSGPGRTRVSPEVAHFLHRFWEMLAYVANTLVFFFVGLLVASQAWALTPGVALLVLGLWAAMVAVRFGVVHAARPLLGRLSTPISVAEGHLVAWGGLRGAVSLALALAVAHHPDVPARLGAQILVVSAGVVWMTILVNATTTRALLHRLGLDRPPLVDRLATARAHAGALREVSGRVAEAASSRDLRTLPWEPVTADLGTRTAALETEARQLSARAPAPGPGGATAGDWRRALAMERRAYWEAFASGTLGRAAVRILDQEVDRHLDALERGDPTPPPRRLERPRGTAWRHALGLAPLRFRALCLLYDLYRGEALAAEGVLSRLGAAAPAEIRAAYRRWADAGREAVEDLRANLPEVSRAIETRLAHRVALNFERAALRARRDRGAMSPRAADEALATVDARMKALASDRTAVPLPETVDVCAGSPLFAALDPAARAAMARITVERVVPRGEVLFRQGDPGDAMYVVVRGAVRVLRDRGGVAEPVDVLESGDFFGEMALVSGRPRSATVVAATTVTLGAIRRRDFERVVRDMPSAREAIRRAYEERTARNAARRGAPPDLPAPSPAPAPGRPARVAGG